MREAAAVASFCSPQQPANEERIVFMRSQLVSLTFALLSVLPPAVAAAPGVGEDAAHRATVAVQRASHPYAGVRDEVAMILIGAGLIVLASAVKRASRFSGFVDDVRR
jgi:hypothetical protein